jgi:hypothetical protein
MLGKKERVFAGPTVELEDMSARLEDVDQCVPYDVALGAADHGPCEQVIVTCGQAIERQDCLRWNFADNRHASTSERDDSIPALACSMLRRRVAALSDSAAGVPARRANCTSSLSSLSA